MTVNAQELVDQFAEWRAHFEKQRANGSPFCGYQPEISDIEQMMALIEEVPAQPQTTREALTAFLTAYGSQESSTAGLDKAAAMARAALSVPQTEREPCPYEIDHLAYMTTCLYGCVLENEEIGPCLCVNPVSRSKPQTAVMKSAERAQKHTDARPEPQTALSREQVAKIFAYIWHGDAGEWQGFLSKADAFLAFPRPERRMVVGRVTGTLHEGDQVPGMPGAICHACGLKDYPCVNPDCPNRPDVARPDGEAPRHD